MLSQTLGRVEAVRFVRKMRGGAQAHLLEADDGHFYVVKFLNNPQHRRVLVNDWIGGALMERVGISCPKRVFIGVSREFLAENPGINIQLARRTIPVEPGVHFASRYPGDPGQLAVYDFIPASLLQRVTNYDQFQGALVFDKWVANADWRQAVFYRTRSGGPFEGQHLVATFIDNGAAFGGSEWEIKSVGPLHGMYHDKAVYEGIVSLESFNHWIAAIESISEQDLWQITCGIPADWMASDKGALEAMLDMIWRRRSRLPDLIEDVLRAKPDLFPNWRTISSDQVFAGTHVG